MSDDMEELRESAEELVQETIKHAGHALFGGYEPVMEKLRPILKATVASAHAKGMEIAEKHGDQSKSIVMNLSLSEAMAMMSVLGHVRTLRISGATVLTKELILADEAFEKVQTVG